MCNTSWPSRKYTSLKTKKKTAVVFFLEPFSSAQFLCSPFLVFFEVLDVSVFSVNYMAVSVVKALVAGAHSPKKKGGVPGMAIP